MNDAECLFIVESITLSKRHTTLNSAPKHIQISKANHPTFILFWSPTLRTERYPFPRYRGCKGIFDVGRSAVRTEMIGLGRSDLGGLGDFREKAIVGKSEFEISSRQKFLPIGQFHGRSDRSGIIPFFQEK